MVPRSAATGAPHPEAVEFVRFCYHRRRVGWPELYDEMCAVAGRGLFRGFSADDLGGIGVGFSLFDMPALASLTARIVAEEVALRRPMNVVIAAAAPEAGSAVPGPAAAAIRAEAATSLRSESTTAASAPPATRPGTTNLVTKNGEERSFDVPIRLALAASRA